MVPPSPFDLVRRPFQLTAMVGLVAAVLNAAKQSEAETASLSSHPELPNAPHA